MKNIVAIFVLVALALTSGQTAPKPAEASPTIYDHREELKDLLQQVQKDNAVQQARIRELEDQLALADAARSRVTPSPLPVVLTATATGGGVCANGSCGQSAGPVHRFVANRPRLLGRIFQGRPRLFGRR